MAETTKTSAQHQPSPPVLMPGPRHVPERTSTLLGRDRSRNNGHPLHRLQRTAGNQAVIRLMSRLQTQLDRVSQPDPKSTTQAESIHPPRLSPPVISGRSALFEASLEHPSDRYEFFDLPSSLFENSFPAGSTAPSQIPTNTVPIVDEVGNSSTGAEAIEDLGVLEKEAEAINEAMRAEAEAAGETGVPEAVAEAVEGAVATEIAEEEIGEAATAIETEATGEAVTPEAELETEASDEVAAEAETGAREETVATETEVVTVEEEAEPEAWAAAGEEATEVDTATEVIEETALPETEAAGEEPVIEEVPAPVEVTAAPGETVEAELVTHLVVETIAEPAVESEVELGAAIGGEADTAADLRSWQADVSGAINVIPEVDIGEAVQEASQVRQQGSAIRGGRQEARRRIPQEAQEAVRATPRIQSQSPQPEPYPVEEAAPLMEEASNRPLPDQHMPDLQRSPRGTLPQVRQAQQVQADQPSAEGEAGPEEVVAPETERRSPDQEQVDELRSHTAEGMQDADREGNGEGVTLSDTGPPIQRELPPHIRTDITSVLARLLADPQSEAENVLLEARKAAYPREMLQRVYEDIGDDRLPDLTGLLTTELHAVADVVGITCDELNSRVEDRRNELERRQGDAADDINEAADEERANLEEEGQEEQDAIAGAHDAVDESIGEQVEAASSEGDPSAICDRRDRLLRQVSRQVGRQNVLYDLAKQRREQQIDAAARAQIQAYQATPRQDEREITAEAEEQPMPLQARLQIAAIRDWADARERQLRLCVTDKKRTAREWTDDYKEGIQEAASQVRELIRDWADEQLGEQTDWWDRTSTEFQDWADEAQAEAEAWEQARAGETRDAILTDMLMLNQFVAQAGENVDLSSEDALRGLGEEHQKVIRAYYSDGPDARNPVTAVATGLRARFVLQHRPQLIEHFKSELGRKPAADWECLNLLGNAQRSSFNADTVQTELYRAMYGGITDWGTDEDRIFRALSGLTPIQSLAVKHCYSIRHSGRNLEADLDAELSGSEQTRAEALLGGDQVLSDVAELREAMRGGVTGWGTDEDTIMRVLRGKSEEERQRIIEVYCEQYDGADLLTDLQGELSSHDVDRATALMEGNVARADAIAIDQAMQGGITGWGTDEAAIESVYNQVRHDVAAEGARQTPPWTTEQVEAEVARRNLSVENSYNARYGDNWEPGDESALRQAYRSELSEAELDLANALADNDLIRADAARLAIEEQDLFVTDDDVVNSVLRHQYERALEEIRRDEWPAIQRELDRRAIEEGWDPYQRRAEERQQQRILEQSARERSRGFMQELEDTYDREYSRWGSGGLQTLVWYNMSGTDRDMAHTLLSDGGYLTPAQEIHYAVEGIGTDEDAIRHALAGRSPEEIRQIREEWARLHPDEDDLDTRLRSELSGREEFDTEMLLQGEPENAEQEMAHMRERAQWEFENSSNFIGSGSEERRVLRDRLDELEYQYEILTNPEMSVSDRDRDLAAELFRQQAGSVSTAIASYREQMDAATDALATAAGVAAAIAVVVVAAILTPFTGGGSAAAGAGILATLASALTSGTVAAAAAVAAATATIVTKQAMLGDAYGGEDMALDIVVGAVDALAAYATAGIGTGLLKAARGGILARMAASSSRMTRVAAHGLAEGAEGLISSLPAAVMGNVLSDRNWEHGNPLVNILTGTAIETGIGTVVSAGMGSFGGLRQVDVPPPKARPSGDILAHRGTPQDRIAQWRAYQAEHPGADMRTFLRQYDEGVALRLADEEAACQLQRQLRTELLSGIPAAQRRQFANTTIEVLSDADFYRLTRSQRGQAVVLIEKGRPRVLLREGADPRVLREEGIHLLQAIDPRLRPKIRQLDERRLANWDNLDINEQFRLYRNKLELEIDAQQRLIRGLDEELSGVGDDAIGRRAVRAQLDEAKQTLNSLRNRLDEVDSITPEQRVRMRRGDPPLDQPARLFAKRDPNWHPPDYPEPPKGHVYRSMSDGEYQLQRLSGSKEPRQAIFKDPKTGERVVIPRGPGAEANYMATRHHGYPEDIPDGHHYRWRGDGEGEYYLYRHDRNTTHHKVVYDEDGNLHIALETNKRPTWDEFKQQLAGAHRAKTAAADVSFQEFNDAVRHMNSVDQMVLGRYKGVVKQLWDQLDPPSRANLIDDLLGIEALRSLNTPTPGGVLRTLTSYQYDQFRRILREKVSDFLAQLPPGRGLRNALDNFLMAAPDKGHLFSAYRRARLKCTAGFDPLDNAPTKLRVQRESGTTVTRNADGALRIGDLNEPRAPPPGRYIVEDKAGSGAFKLKQAQDYARASGDDGIRLRPSDQKAEYDGLVYFFDSLDNAKKAFRSLNVNPVTSPALNASKGGIFIAYINDIGEIEWYKP